MRKALKKEISTKQCKQDKKRKKTEAFADTIQNQQ